MKLTSYTTYALRPAASKSRGFVRASVKVSHHNSNARAHREDRDVAHVVQTIQGTLDLVECFNQERASQ